MSNNYETVTWMRDIPESKITEADRLILSAFCFEAEELRGDVYIFSENGVSDSGDAAERLQEMICDFDEDQINTLKKQSEVFRAYIDEDASLEWENVVTEILNRLPAKEFPFIDVDAGFWNGDPDIDAICRLEHAPECEFDPSFFPIASSVMAPFNSQNTMLAREVVPCYFLYPHIGRMDDIWAAYYVQAHGFQAVFSEPSVYQDRNEHDLIRDLKAEIIGYTNNLSLIRDLKRDPESIVAYLPGPAVRAWDLYRRHFR